MDYLDPKKELRHNVLLLAGYVLIAVAITISTLVLLYQAYGFGIDKNGAVVQNGLTFFSSHPHPANIYVNNQLKTVKTNTRLVLPSGVYSVKLTREGYYDWQRKIELNGGSVEHFDYPFLFPKELVTKKFQNQTYASAPGLMTQSPDHRWLLVAQPASLKDFTLFDLKSPDKQAETVSLPDNTLTKAIGAESIELAEWADDNQHVLLKHLYDGKTEFILMSRANPAESVNLSTKFSINPTQITLNNKKYDQYNLYDSVNGSLSRINLKDNEATPLLQHVLAYKTYGDNTILYVTDNGAAPGKVRVRMTDGDKTWTIRTLTRGSTYVVDLTEYDSNLYVAAGSAADNRVYIYKDPVAQLSQESMNVAVPSQVLHVDAVNYLSFSANAQFIVAENGTRFGVYDIENETGYNFTATYPLDTPQAHASWMDGNRLTYISNGHLVVFDYDNTNAHTLMVAGSSYLPAFDQDSKYVYEISPNAAGQTELTQTALLTQKDL